MASPYVKIGGLCAVVVLLASSQGIADLDIAVPPGTPLDWDKELHQPIPTGGPRGAVKPTDNGKGGTIVKQNITPPPIAYSSVNLYNYFRVKTQDIKTHVTVNMPKRPKAPPPPEEVPNQATGPGGNAGSGGTRMGDDPAKKNQNAGKWKPGVGWDYPPQVPGELVWIAIANLIRISVHPELVSEAEIEAYLVELGEPTLIGANSFSNELGNKLKKIISDIPNEYPPIPPAKNPKDALLNRFVVIDLTSGFPYAFDPNYAKHTLIMGDLAYDAVVDCTKSTHPFLMRNAVAVLANFSGKKAAADLRKIFQTTTDPVAKMRALSGLIRKRDTEAIPLILNSMNSPDEALRAMSIYALGYIARKDPKVADKLVFAATNLPSEDMLWAVIPALARIKDGSKATVDFLKNLQNGLTERVGKVKAKQPGPQLPNGVKAPPIDPPGSKLKIIYEMITLALAANGDAAAQSDVTGKFEKGGLTSFQEANQFLVSDVLPHCGAKGLEQAKGLTSADVSIAVNVVKRIGELTSEVDWLKGVATGGGVALVRAAALTVLVEQTDTVVKEACDQIVKSYSDGGLSGPENAFLVGMAMQMLGRLGGNDGETMLKAVQKALEAKAIGSRKAENEYDITAAKIELHPPLLEIALLELGKTMHAPAIETLVKILDDTQSETARAVRGEAALALGNFAEDKAVDALLNALVDPLDGWVRFCAYLSLKNITGQDNYVDYVWGDVSSIAAMKAKFAKAWQDKKGK